MSVADILAKANGFVWGPVMLIFLVGTGIVLEPICVFAHNFLDKDAPGTDLTTRGRGLLTSNYMLFGVVKSGS